MSKVQVTSHIEIDVEDMLKGVAQLEPDELERIVNKLLALQAQQRAVSLSQTETELLQQINQGLASSVDTLMDQLGIRQSPAHA